MQWLWCPVAGPFGMEAVARQFGKGANVLVVRNGWFSYRWSQIFEMGDLTASTTVLKARQTGNVSASPFAPAPIAEVVEAIRTQKPDVVFAPHVETSAGVILPDDYVSAMAAAAHEVGALMVLDCIASGCAWVDMKATGVDVLISAPQKGWSASPCAGLVMLSERAVTRVGQTQPTVLRSIWASGTASCRRMKTAVMPIMRPCQRMLCVIFATR